MKNELAQEKDANRQSTHVNASIKPISAEHYSDRDNTSAKALRKYAFNELAGGAGLRQLGVAFSYIFAVVRHC